MNNILNYLDWRKSSSLNEAKGSEKMILLSGPSASGKSTLAKELGAKSWHSGENLDTILIGTDDFNGNDHFKEFKNLLVGSGLKKLSSFSDDWHWLVETFFKKEFKNWMESADRKELKRYKEIKKEVGFNKSKTSGFDGRPDGRVCGMAWVAYLYPAKKIIFDDIDIAIKNYFEVKEILLFTPLDFFINNIKSRNKSSDSSSRINVNDKNSALYQYCNWYEATDSPDLENKKYNTEKIMKLLSEAGHDNPKKIIELLGAKDMKDFYLTTKDWVKPNVIVNSREKSSGRAISIDKLKF
jgi:hypothetical protein